MDALFDWLGSDGSAAVALVAALVLFGGLFLERALIRRAYVPYFRLGFPLGADLVPLTAEPAHPDGLVECGSVAWSRPNAEEIVFSTSESVRAAPMLLHGLVELVPIAGRIAMRVRWSPPLSYLLAAGWLALLGVLRGEAGLTTPIALLIVIGALFLYRSAALRAAAEVRFSLASRGGL